MDSRRTGMARRFLALALVLAVFVVLPGTAWAQVNRTWVSGTGDDFNPCDRNAPCKTFNGAISKTAPGGVIGVLDPGNYGPVFINKSLTIETDGALAGIWTIGSNAILVNAAATDTVTLRRIAFEGLDGRAAAIRDFRARRLLGE